MIEIPQDLAAPIINSEIRRVEKLRKFNDFVENRRSFIIRKRRLRSF